MQEVLSHLKKIKTSSIVLRTMSTEIKNTILQNLVLQIKNHEVEILAANDKDVKAYAQSATFQKAFADRLALNPARLKQMIESIEAVIAAADPIGQSLGQNNCSGQAVCDTPYYKNPSADFHSKLANGLQLEQVRGPLGVCFMIFESRPNVIIEAFSLALKSANALILKGGKESDATAQYLYQLINESIKTVMPTADIFWGMVGASRETTDFLMKQHKLIDVLIPRGGERLIEYVTENSSIPLIKNDRGLCHIYVHEQANFAMALQIIENAKTQRPGVCNAMETLLLDEKIASEFLPKVYKALNAKGVEFYVCSESLKILKDLEALETLEDLKTVYLASESNFDTEYLDLILNVKIVKSVVAALAHIEEHGSHHSEAIITEDAAVAEDFLKKVDAAVVYWNASTRFTDGYQFGLGGEMGISTQKLHVRGPVGLLALTVPRWLVRGQGQVRP
jgi:glutamate-5-semialdehyde dehydrogenase